MAKGYEFRRTNQTAIGNVLDNLKVWVAGVFGISSEAGNAGLYHSPTDFTSVWGAANRIDLSNLPEIIQDVRNFVRVVRFDNTGLATSFEPEVNVFVWTPVTATTGQLTVTGAVFAATDTFVVEILAQVKTGYGDSVARITHGLYVSPYDFSAIFFDADELTIGVALPVPFVFDDRCWLRVVQVRANNNHIIYLPDRYPMTYSAVTGRLTVQGAQFDALSTYRVEMSGPAKSVYLDDSIPVPGRYVTAIGGIDAGVGNQIRMTDCNAAGELLVRSDTPANFNNTEVNSGGIRTAVEIIDNMINTDGAAETTQGAMVGGSDGVNYHHVFTNATGEVRVVQPAAANLNNTEVNSTAIRTAVEIIDNVVATHDAVRATQSALVGSRAHSGNPAPVSADDDQADVLATLLGQLRVYIDSALNTVNDEVRAEDIPPPEIVAHGNTTNSATEGNTTQLTAVSSTLRRGVWMMVNPNQGVAMPGAGVRNILGASYTAANNTIISTAGVFPNLAGFSCRRTALVEGCINDVMFIPIDDPSKIYIASNTASLEALWVAI